jgi:hypothetical protein
MAAIPPLTWPDVGLLLALLAVVVYHRPVGRLLDRINLVRVGSTRLSAKPQPDVPRLRTPRPPRPPPSMAVDPFLEEGRAGIRTLLDQHVGSDPCPQTGHAIDPSRLPSSAAWGFERIYSFIFGSQVQALYLLNSSPVVPLARFREVYDRAVAANPEPYAEFTFDQ